MNPLSLIVVATEYTDIDYGEAAVNSLLIRAGIVVTIPPGEAIDFHILTDCATALVKLPCVRGGVYHPVAVQQP